MRDPTATGRRPRPAGRRRPGTHGEPVSPLRVPPAAPLAGQEVPSSERDDATTASALNVLAGIWLVIAPWVLGYSTAASRWNDVACGGAVILLAAVRVSAPARRAWLSLVNVAIGIWLIITSFALSSYGTEWANDIILGAIVALLGLWSSAAGSDAGRLAPRRRRRREHVTLLDERSVEALEASLGEERGVYPPPPQARPRRPRR